MPYVTKKLGLYVFLLFYLISFVNALSITEELEIGESITLEGRNVTLMDLETKEDKILVCINGEKNIIPKAGKTVKGVLIEPRKVTSTYAEIRLKTTEKGTCGIECSNTACFEKKVTPVEESTTTTSTTLKKVETTTTTIKEAIPTGAVVKEESKISIFYFVFLGLILIIGSLVAFRKNRIYSKK